MSNGPDGNDNTKSGAFCFTINNYTDEDIKEVNDYATSPTCIYLVYGKEIGPENGTPHLQGYVQFTCRKTRATVSKIRCFRKAYLVASRADNAQAAADYCKEDGDWQEFGTIKISKQGKRSDLEEVKTSIDEGKSTEDLWDNHFSSMVRYENSFKRYKAIKSRRDSNVDIEVFVLWGGTGVGKSRFPRFIDGGLFSVPDVTLQWWDGYDGQDVILIDDFDGKDCPIARMLRYLDRYDVQVPVKGAFLPLLAKRIWISSNTHPNDWFPQELQVKRDALSRRITKIINVVDPIEFDNEGDLNRLKGFLRIE